MKCNTMQCICVHGQVHTYVGHRCKVGKAQHLHELGELCVLESAAYGVLSTILFFLDTAEQTKHQSLEPHAS